MIKIENKNLEGNIHSISSKSMAHRHLICSALSECENTIYLPDISDDIQVTINCLKTLGADINIKNKYLHIKPVNLQNLKKQKEDIVKIFDCKESGTTLRFLIPVISFLLEKSVFTGSGRLPDRPIKELTDLLKNANCILSSDKLPIEITNRFKFKNIDIKGNISSQYISGLLLSAVLQDEDININIIGKLESKPYVDMTIKVMKEYGISVNQTDTGYFISKDSKFISPKNSVVEGDWSNSAFFLVAGAIGQNPVSIEGLDINSVQGDKKILEILKNIGANIKIDKDNIQISNNDLRPVDIDVSDIPDLLPILSILSAKILGKTRFYNAKRLRLKESDRLTSTSNMIKNLGGEVIEKEDELIIIGKGKLEGGQVNSYNDHRIAMSACIASIISTNPVILTGENAVNKSYIKFYEDFKSLGGQICHL